MSGSVRPEFNVSSVRAAVAAWLGLFVGPNAMVSASMSLFIAPIGAEFHLKRSAISAIRQSLCALTRLSLPGIPSTSPDSRAWRNNAPN